MSDSRVSGCESVREMRQRAERWKSETRRSTSPDMLWQNRTFELARDVLALVERVEAAEKERDIALGQARGNAQAVAMLDSTERIALREEREARVAAEARVVALEEAAQRVLDDGVEVEDGLLLADPANVIALREVVEGVVE